MSEFTACRILPSTPFRTLKRHEWAIADAEAMFP
jgi:hypothetical protein